MSNRSPYIDEIILSPKHSGRRNQKVQAFVIHHMAARWTAKRCAEYLRDTPSRQASANYYIGYDGEVVLGVEEENRAWTSSSNWADQRAITYELANSAMGHPWTVSDSTIQKAILMLAEQHKRYGLKEASYTGDTKGTLWRHDWFASTTCPGPYLGGKLSYMADEINKILKGENNTYTVKAGDTLWAIATAYGVSVDNLKDWNDLSGDLINPGQELVLKAGTPKPQHKPQAPTVQPSASRPANNVAVNGRFFGNAATIRALQRHFGTSQTGAISDPPARSLLIEAMQRFYGSPVTGQVSRGDNTSLLWTAMQRYHGTSVTGKISPSGSLLIQAVQRQLNNGTYPRRG